MEQHFAHIKSGDALDRDEVKLVLEQLGYYPEDELLEAFLIHLSKKLGLETAEEEEEEEEHMLSNATRNHEQSKKGISVAARPASSPYPSPSHSARPGVLGTERRLANASLVYDRRAGRVRHDPVRMMSLYKNEWSQDSFLSPRKRSKRKTSYVKPATPAAVKHRAGYDPVAIYQQTKKDNKSRRARSLRRRY